MTLRMMLFALLTVGPVCRCDHTWQVGGLPGDGGWFPSLAVDGRGLPHVSSVAADHGGYTPWSLLYQARTPSGAWGSVLLDREDPHSYGTSIAVDGNAVPHILFTRGGIEYASHIRYATRVGDEWVIEQIEEHAYIQLAPRSIAIDSQGHPVVLYQAGARDWHLAVRGAGGWSIEPVDALTGAWNASILLDREDRRHIAAVSESEVNCITDVGGLWRKETVAPIQGASASYWVPTLALGEDGEPRVAYLTGAEYYTGELRYASRRDGQWSVQTVAPQAGWSSLVTLGSVDMIAYAEPIGGQGYRVLLATEQNGGWSTELVAPYAEVFWGLDARAGPDGFVHAVFDDWSFSYGSLLVYALGRPIVDVGAPGDLLAEGFNWFSIPMEPVDSSEASDVLGRDVSNRLFRWDAVGKNVELYPDDFTDIWPSIGYVLYLDQPLQFGYRGVVPYPAAVQLPEQGVTWIGIPGQDDVPQGDIRIENNATGESRTVAEDAESPSPWLNANWVYYDNQNKTAKILIYDGSGDDTIAHPWLMYRTWSFVEDLTLRMR